MKKFLRYIFTIALFGAMCFGGYKYITDWGKPDTNYLPELEAPITSADEYIATYITPDEFLEGNTQLLSDCVIEIFRDLSSFDEKTIICTGDNFDESFTLYSADDETANNLLRIASEKHSFSGYEWTNPSYSSIQDARKNAVALVEGLSEKRETVDGYFYVILINDMGNRAFGKQLFQEGKEVYLGNLNNYLENAGLKLEVKNAEAKKILVLQPVLETENQGSMYALVECDLTCVENFGSFKDLSWIPNIGETKKTQFIISYSSEDTPRSDFNRKEIDLFDICVFSQEE